MNPLNFWPKSSLVLRKYCNSREYQLECKRLRRGATYIVRICSRRRVARTPNQEEHVEAIHAAKARTEGVARSSESASQQRPQALRSPRPAGKATRSVC